MRQSQKTETKADRLSKIGLENRKYTRARSTNSGKSKGMSVTFQDLVLDRNNLNQAYLRVKRNKGADGIDGLTVDELLPYLRENKEELIAKLKDGSYKPSPVKRVEIPKPNGGKRKLGIPTVVDRMVQQAVAQMLTPIFEQVFSDNSFGFRPQRGAQDAVALVVDLYNQGYRRVVDLDLKAYFDNVNHDLMMKYLQQYIDDPWVLRLIRKFLTSGVLDHGLFAKSEKGTPQGGPLSPLLANIYLNELEKELTRRGHHFVRYADDCNIYVKSQRAGERVMRSITQFLEKRLKVKVNPDKTKVGSPLRLKFLGFSLGVDHNGTYARPAKQSQQRVKKALKLLTKRNRGISLTRMFEEIHRTGAANRFRKKISRNTQSGGETTGRYQAIQEMNNEGYSISELAKVAGITRQAYYKWLKHEPTKYEIEESEILQLIKQLENEHKQSVGYDKMTRLIKLSQQISYTVNKKRVIRIMKDHSIKADYRQPTHKRIQAQQTYEAENILN